MLDTVAEIANSPTLVTDEFAFAPCTRGSPPARVGSPRLGCCWTN